jgi:hypothetical protein
LHDTCFRVGKCIELGNLCIIRFYNKVDHRKIIIAALQLQNNQCTRIVQAHKLGSILQKIIIGNDTY